MFFCRREWRGVLPNCNKVAASLNFFFVCVCSTVVSQRWKDERHVEIHRRPSRSSSGVSPLLVTVRERCGVWEDPCWKIQRCLDLGSKRTKAGS